MSTVVKIFLLCEKKKRERKGYGPAPLQDTLSVPVIENDLEALGMQSCPQGLERESERKWECP